MYLRLLFIVSFYLVSYSTLAQDHVNIFEVGFKGGLNYSTVAKNKLDNPKARKSFHVGLLGDYKLSKRFSLQIEGLYSGEGFELNNMLTQGDNVEYQLYYLQVPLLLKFFLTEGLNVQVGGQLGFKIGEQIYYNMSIKEGEDGEVIIGGNTNHFFNHSLPSAQTQVFSGVVGSEYKFDTGFLIHLRYNYGFTNLFETSEWQKDLKVNTSIIQAGVGFIF